MAGAAIRNKVSLTVTENTGVIVGALSFGNPYDGHTLPAVIAQYESIFGRPPKDITVDRGYKGRTLIGQTAINIPKPFNSKKLTAYRQKKLRGKFRRRAAIEPVIGHVKTDHRVGRNFYKGVKGDHVNVLLGAAGFNFKRMLNKYKKGLFGWLENLLLWVSGICQGKSEYQFLNKMGFLRLDYLLALSETPHINLRS